MTSRRSERLAEEIREEVARVVGSDLKDPRIGFVTVTRATLSDDLRHARLYVSVLGGERQREAGLAALRQAAGFLRRAVGRRIRARYTPELSFHYDTGLDAAERVAHLLDEVKEDLEREGRPDGNGEDE